MKFAKSNIPTIMLLLTILGSTLHIEHRLTRIETKLECHLNPVSCHVSKPIEKKKVRNI